MSPAVPVVTTHLRIIKRILRALKPNARNLPNNIVVLKSPLDLAMYHVTCPLPSSVCISGSVKFAGHSRRQCCRGVLHQKGVEVRPVLRVGEAGCRCQYCQSNPVRQHVQQKTKHQFYNVNLQWGIQKSVIIVQVSFVVPKEIAHAVPCVRVVVSGQEKVDVSPVSVGE